MHYHILPSFKFFCGAINRSGKGGWRGFFYVLQVQLMSSMHLWGMIDAALVHVL